MSFFSSIAHGLSNIVQGTFGGILGNPGGTYGTNNIIGGAINDITGTSDSARQQYKYNAALQEIAQDFNAAEAEKTRNFNAEQAQMERDWQTEMSNTARQRAAEDLKAAGMNPVLAAGASADAGAGAAASGGQATSPGGNTGAGVASGNPITAIIDVINAKNNTAKTNADIENETNMVNTEIWKILKETDPNIDKAIAEYNYLVEEAELAKDEQAKKKAETKILDWEGRHPILAKILPGASAVASTALGVTVGGASARRLGKILKNSNMTINNFNR